jgi:hypothetical protein
MGFIGSFLVRTWSITMAGGAVEWFQVKIYPDNE